MAARNFIDEVVEQQDEASSEEEKQGQPNPPVFVKVQRNHDTVELIDPAPEGELKLILENKRSSKNLDQKFSFRDKQNPSGEAQDLALPGDDSMEDQKEDIVYNKSIDGKSMDKKSPQKPYKSNPLRHHKEDIVNKEIKNYFKSSICQPEPGLLSSDASSVSDPDQQSNQSHKFSPNKPDRVNFVREVKKEQLLNNVKRAHKLSGGFFKIDYGSGSDSSSVFSDSQN